MYKLTKLNTMLVMMCVSFFPVFSIAAEPVQLIAQNSRSVTFEVTVPQPVFEPLENGGGFSCSVNGYNTYHLPGKPAIVLRGVMVAVPHDSSVEIDVSVNASSEIEDIDIGPVPTPGDDTGTFDEYNQYVHTRDPDVYQRNEYFPSTIAEIEYIGTLRGRRIAHVLITPLRYNPVQRVVSVANRMTVTLTFTGMKEQTQANNIFVSTESVFDGIQDSLLLNADSFFAAQYVQSAEPVQVFSQASVEVQSSPFSVKILTSAPGMYQIRYEDLASLGIDLSGLTNSNVTIENFGREVSVYCSGSGVFQAGDFILFYAEDFQSLYSATNVYWLYQGENDGLRMQTLESSPDSGFPQRDSFSTTMRLEQNMYWHRNLPDYIAGEDEWFWQPRLNVFGITTLALPFTMTDFALDAGDFEIEVCLRGLSAFNHHTQVSLNGIVIDDIEWTGFVIERTITDGISPLLFNDGANTLTVQALPAAGNDPASTPDSYYVNWADIENHRNYVADNNRLAFGSDSVAGTTIEVTGFTNSDISVYDVTVPDTPVLLTGVGIGTDAGESSVRFEHGAYGLSPSFYAATSSSYLQPDELLVDSPSSLQSSRDSVDYIIITHAQFASTVEQLKTLREQGGLHVEIVDVQDIYDEFSYGIKDAAAIKDFLQFAYFNWHATDHPTYVVFVGDATYDYRDYLGLAAQGKADLIPTYLGYRATLGSTGMAAASDNWFVCVDGDDPLPDMIIGRLSVKQTQDLQNIIDKIEAYEGALQDDWHSRIMYAADKDNDDLFENILASLHWYMPLGYTAVNLNLQDYGTDIETATNDLIDAISNGAFITNYAGHGSTDTWSNSAWFRTPNPNAGQTRDDVALLTNTDRYTFLIVLNCLSGMFSEANDDFCLAEEFVRQQERGAIASVSPSGSGLPTNHKILGNQMYNSLFNNDIHVAGAMVTAAKISAYQITLSRDLLETFNFLGDPAIELKVLDIEPECETDADCDSGFECISGICTGNGECEVNSDCSDGFCINNECVSDQIDKCKVKAGKNDNGDSITFQGFLYAAEADFTIGSNVVVSIEASNIPDPGETVFTVPIGADNLKNGKYKAKVNPFDKSEPVTSFKLDTVKGKFKFSAKNADLSGLSCPITVTIQIGDYVATMVLYEDIVNGSKPCPPELMDGI